MCACNRLCSWDCKKCGRPVGGRTLGDRKLLERSLLIYVHILNGDAGMYVCMRVCMYVVVCMFICYVVLYAKRIISNDFTYLHNICMFVCHGSCVT